jgi:hypothetical protein
MELALASLAIAVLVICNGLATRVVWRDRFAERHQRMFQLLAIWLAPVFGAILVFALHRKPEEPSRKYRENRDPLDGIDDAGAARHVGRSIQSTADD